MGGQQDENSDRIKVSYCTKNIRMFFLPVCQLVFNENMMLVSLPKLHLHWASQGLGEKSFRRMLSSTFPRWGMTWSLFNPCGKAWAALWLSAGRQGEGDRGWIGCWNWVNWNRGEFRCLLMSLNHWQKCFCYHMPQHDTSMETLQITMFWEPRSYWKHPRKWVHGNS